MIEPNPNDPNSDWEEEYVEYIGPVIDRYIEAHSHRTPGTRYAFETVINDFLTSTGLHENMRLERINREACQRWKAILLGQLPHPVPSARAGKRERKAITIQIALKNFSHFTRWLVGQDLIDKDPMHGLLLNARVVSDSETARRGLPIENWNLSLQT